MKQCFRLMLVVILAWMILAWTLLMGIRSRILLFPNAFVAPAPPNAFVAPAPPNASVATAPPNASVATATLDASVATAPPNASVAAGLSKLEQHHVEIKSPKLLCELKTARLRTVDGSEQPFSSLGWSHLVPSVPLEQLHRRQENQSSFKSCAVVASAGAMLHSGLGEEIDSHEAVMRFNHAPTGGYEKDVGTRTTFRLINKQILYKPKFQFKTSSLYHNVTLVAWGIAPRDLNLTKWLDPGQPFYVLHPSYVWQLWEVIQGTTQERITPNPPTSGFMGILVMMALCDEVHVYEYIPSTRQTALCHYFEDGYDIRCSLGGGWHPLKFEKALIRQIITGSETDLKRGRATLPGFSSVNCE